MTAFLTSTLARLSELGDRTALRKGTETRTYREVVESCYKFARVLRDAGYGRGDGLVLISRNPIDMYGFGLAVQLLGIRYTPVYAGQPIAHLAHIVTDSRARAVVVDGDVDIPGLRLSDLAAAAEKQSTEALPVQARDGDIARILYTGGTTGAPKGVAFTYEALLNAGRAWAGNPPPPNLRFVAMTPLAHAGGAAAFGLLPHGVEIEIFDEFDAGRLCQSIDAAARENRLVTTYLYPTLLYRLLDHPDLPRTNLAGLAFLAYGSAPVLPERVEQAVRVLGPRLRQSYAQTEAIAICALGPEDHAKAAAGRPELFASAGRPVPGVDVQIRDGEIWVSGPTVMEGYWRRPDLDAEVLAADGAVRTGDLGRLDDEGYLYVEGRAADRHLTEIEAALRALPQVDEAVVVKIGAGLLAVCRVAGEPSAELRKQAEASARSARVEFVDELPYAAYGKPDKEAIRARFE